MTLQQKLINSGYKISTKQDFPHFTKLEIGDKESGMWSYVYLNNDYNSEESLDIGTNRHCS